MTEQVDCPRCHRLVPRQSLLNVSVGKHKGLGGEVAVVSVCESCFPIVKNEVDKQWVAEHFGPRNDRLSGKQLREQTSELDRHPSTVLFRIHAYTKDLDIPLVRSILAKTTDNPLIRRQYEDEHDGIAGIEFRDGPSFQTWSEIEQWQRPVFRNAVEWLKTKSEKEIVALHEAGLQADVCIIPQLGKIPRELLQEIVRLKLDCVLIPLPPERFK